MLKNKICLILLVISLMFAPVTFGEDEPVAGTGVSNEVAETVNDNTASQSAEENVGQLDEDNVSEQSLNEDAATVPYKHPSGKKKIALKFLLAMVGVAVSSFVIYFGLAVYNRLRDGFVQSGKFEIPSDEDKSLRTPDNLSEAVKTFIEKTDWSE